MNPTERPASKTAATWQAYSDAYRGRYGVDPVRNRAVNGQLANFIDRIPADEAPAVAAFYVDHPNALYCNAQHPVNLMLRDAESLRTQWTTGRKVLARNGNTHSVEPEWRREQRERTEAFAGPAAAKRRQTTIDMEASNAPADLLG